MVAVSHPHLRPEVGAKVAKYSQRQVDLLDLAANRFASCPLAEVLAGADYPNLYLFVSVMRDNYPYDPASVQVDGQAAEWVLTFNNFLRRTDFVKLLGRLLTKLEQAYGQPVDTEFTASVDDQECVRINLLQCRPLFLPGSAATVTAPVQLERRQVLFRAQRLICGGLVENIRYILYIDPRDYNAIAAPQIKKAVGRVVGEINRHPAVRANPIMLMGPGRWGSSNLDLGVNVGYADIDNTAVLVEIALEEAGHVPEVSYGTHFFQDLVEAQVIYLPVYPDRPAAEFQAEFFATAPNALLQLLPQAAEYAGIVHLIDVPAATGGALATVIADAQRRQAVCFLRRP
jgi:hypothetical protein